MLFKNCSLTWLAVLAFSSSLYSSVSFKEIVSYVTPKKQEEILTKQYRLGKKSSVYAKTTRGSIAIKTWCQEKIVVELVKHGSEKDLESLALTTSFTKEEVRLNALQKPKCKGTVNFNIIVPRHATLILHTAHGSIHVCQPHGALDASTGKGPITVLETTNVVNARTDRGNILVHYKKFQEPTTATIGTNNGNITLALPITTHASLNARTLHGKLTSTLYVTPNPLHTKLNQQYWDRVRRECSGNIGNGGPLIKLTVTSGNITITDS